MNEGELPSKLLTLARRDREGDLESLTSLTAAHESRTRLIVREEHHGKDPNISLGPDRAFGN
jgi:hypothetical protein